MFNKKKKGLIKKNGVEDLPWSKRPPAHGPEVRAGSAGWLQLQEGKGWAERGSCLTASCWGWGSCLSASETRGRRLARVLKASPPRRPS